ncbi:MAG: zinc-ribbon domain-containing protein [Candidatus Thorarchaeota archaeon]
MSQQSNGNRCMGLFLIVIPIFALIFGSDEPAMQTDNAALVMTGMLVVGIILLASSSKKKASVSSAAYPTYPTYYPTQTSSTEGSVMTHGSGGMQPSSSRYCPHCGTPVSVSGARYCESCGASI